MKVSIKQTKHSIEEEDEDPFNPSQRFFPYSAVFSKIDETTGEIKALPRIHVNTDISKTIETTVNKTTNVDKKSKLQTEIVETVIVTTTHYRSDLFDMKKKRTDRGDNDWQPPNAIVAPLQLQITTTMKEIKRIIKTRQFPIVTLSMKWIQRLPSECLIKVFSYLHPYQQLAKLAPYSRLYDYALLEATRSNWDALTAFEEKVNAHFSIETKRFFARWNQSTPLFQRCLTYRGGNIVSMYPIRELVVPGTNPDIDKFSNQDFICIAENSIDSVHKDWEVTLLTFIDVHGFVPTKNLDGSTGPGIPGSIVEIEYVDHGDGEELDAEVESDEGFNVKRQLELLPRGSSQYNGHGYSSDGLGTVAPDLLSLLTMMKQDRFYYEDEPTSIPVMWARSSGNKSFLGRNGDNNGIILDDEEVQSIRMQVDSPEALYKLKDGRKVMWREQYRNV